MKKTYLLLVFILSFIVISCNRTKEYKIPVDDNLKAAMISDNYRVYYEIFIGSFSDSNNDGIGDLKGIINRFDYLNDGDPNSGQSLGIDGIWLSPMMPSPSYHKYDVTNYKNIDSKLGTLDDFEALIKIANERDVKIIIDLVINHTSDWHPWFREFKKSYQENDLTNPYRDYYTVKHKDNLDLNSKYYPIYSGSDYYYEGNFSSSMPELNFDNPKVKEEIADIAKFWIDLGVSGFRLDAAKYVYFNNTEKNLSFWDWFMTTVKSYKSDIYVVGETWSSENEMLPYYQNFNNFDFSFSQLDGEIAQAARVTSSVKSFVSNVKTYYDKVLAINNEAILSPFISNHDMDRAAGYLNVEDGIMGMAANLYILGPGNPYIYYGEEIGMKGYRGTANTDANRRLAMLWGDGDKVKDPTGTTYDSSFQVNGTVKTQLSDKDSLYNHYKKLIMLRKANPEIARGTYTPITYQEKDTFGGFISSYEGSTVVVFHNTGIKELEIDLSKYTDIQLSILRGYAGRGTAELSSDGKTLKISGLTSVILK
ncbi:alpha-amylase family glycosyl hydrolase [Acholeplasma hippikon]|uniref:Alpha-amylase n=1 Tax=Acholeplasma hippikon TaxID=264636 RepID=A0A449BIT5_9MOLU|nr:alpha-amylase family glycosyl hydrolase [Acholeplasma hippikon]VEU82350.1 Alpha-amylase precursor [Acholeplasma hippikon]